MSSCWAPTLEDCNTVETRVFDVFTLSCEGRASATVGEEWGKISDWYSSLLVANVLPESNKAEEGDRISILQVSEAVFDTSTELSLPLL
jgi:hypothetical protein